MKDKILGRTLGGYKIVKPLGMGGMATVYKAFDPQTERHVAIKILPEYYAQYPEFKIRFEREAKSIAQLEHLHILPIFAYGEEDDITYIVMRYLDGGTLTKYIRKNDHLPLPEAHRILTQMAEALDYAHERGIIHRDVKPTNILIDNRGNAILTDFGVAKMLESDHPDLTATGGIVGTPKYMSPEQCQGRKVLTPASDQYSLGIVLYEMVTGNVPFYADTPLAIIQQHLTAPMPPPRDDRPDLPITAENVMFRALARSPHNRYDNCVTFAKAFGRAINEPIESGVGKINLNDTQPSLSMAPASHTVAGNTLANPSTPITVTPTPDLPPISHPMPAAVPLPRAKSNPFIWFIGMLSVAILVGGSAYLGIQFLTDTELPSDKSKDSIEINDPAYTVGETLWPNEDVSLIEQDFADGQRFWETIATDETVLFRPSGIASQDVIYFGEHDWANYQLNLRFQTTSSFTSDSLIPLVELRLNPTENVAYVLAYGVTADKAELYLVRQVDCKEVNACQILASTEIAPLMANQWVNLEFGVYENTLSLTWQTENNELATLTALDEDPLLLGQIGLVMPSGQVFLYEQIEVRALVAAEE